MFIEPQKMRDIFKIFPWCIWHYKGCFFKILEILNQSTFFKNWTIIDGIIEILASNEKKFGTTLYRHDFFCKNQYKTVKTPNFFNLGNSLPSKNPKKIYQTTRTPPSPS